MEKVYINVYKDMDDLNEEYFIVTKHDCSDLLDHIERYYYDFDEYENIEDLIKYLKDDHVDERLVEYISTQDDVYDLTSNGIGEFIDHVISYLDEEIPHEYHYISY